MKKPRGIYFVAAWCCLAMLMQVSHFARRIQLSQPAGQLPMDSPYAWIPLLGLVLLVWETVSLIQLKAIARWFCVAFMVWWSVTLTYNSLIISASARMNHRGLVVAIVLWLVINSLNLSCAWYLSRRKFREFCAICKGQK
jgi:hypothetical protein